MKEQLLELIPKLAADFATMDLTRIERYNPVGASKQFKSFARGQSFWSELGYVALVFVGIYLLIKVFNRK